MVPVIHQYAAFYHTTQGGSVYEADPDGNAAAEIKTLFNTIKKAVAA